MSELKNMLQSLVVRSQMMDDGELRTALADLVYEAYGDNTMAVLLHIQERDRRKRDQRANELYRGAEFAMHSLAGVSQHLLEDKTSAKAKNQVAAELDGDNIAYMLPICRAIWPRGHAKNGSSEMGRWFFKKFRDMLVRNRAKYSEGGSSRNWANTVDYEAYIDIVLKEFDAETPEKPSNGKGRQK